MTQDLNLNLFPATPSNYLQKMLDAKTRPLTPMANPIADRAAQLPGSEVFYPGQPLPSEKNPSALNPPASEPPEHILQSNDHTLKEKKTYLNSFVTDYVNNPYYAVASVYGVPGKDNFNGRRMANGQRMRTQEKIVAHKAYPLGTKLRITNPANDKSVVAIVKDRGPYIKGRDIDMSLGTKKAIGAKGLGIVKVEIEEWGDGVQITNDYREFWPKNQMKKVMKSPILKQQYNDWKSQNP